MTIQRWLAAGAAMLAGALAWQAAPAVAHHATGPFYDADRRVEIEGPVTRFVFRNPHAFLFVTAKGAQGVDVEWTIELGAPVSLRRTGWTPDTLTAGTIVKVSGQASRAEGSHGMCCVRMTRADGSPIVAGGRVEEAQQSPR